MREESNLNHDLRVGPMDVLILIQQWKQGLAD